MKIKVSGFSEDDIKNGFEIGRTYSVTKVDITGDTQAYDIWYHISNGEYDTCVQELYWTDTIEEDKNVEQVINDIDSMMTKHSDKHITFEVEIRL